MTTSRRTFYGRKTSASSKGKKSKSKRRNRGGGMSDIGPIRPNAIPEHAVYAIIRHFGELAYTDKLNGFSDEQLIQRLEALNAKIQELKDCYSVERLSSIESRLYTSIISYFSREIEWTDLLLKKRRITPIIRGSIKEWMEGEKSIYQHPTDYKKGEWLKSHRGIGLPPRDVCSANYRMLWE